MKTIIRNGTNVSLYLFDDATKVVVADTEIIVGNPTQLIIGDCNATNATLYTNVNSPSDWESWKYFFDGATWTLNPNYVPPTTPQV